MEKEMATHSSIPAWRISGTGEPGVPQSMGSQESDTTWRLNHDHHQEHSKQQSVGRTGQMNGDWRVFFWDVLRQQRSCVISLCDLIPFIHNTLIFQAFSSLPLSLQIYRNAPLSFTCWWERSVFSQPYSHDKRALLFPECRAFLQFSVGSVKLWP